MRRLFGAPKGGLVDTRLSYLVLRRKQAVEVKMAVGRRVGSGI